VPSVSSEAGLPRHWTRAEVEDELQFPPEEGPPLKSLKNAHWPGHCQVRSGQWQPVVSGTADAGLLESDRDSESIELRFQVIKSGSISALRTSESELLQFQSESVPQVTALALTGRLTWPHSLATLKVCCPEGPRGMAS
jgi:hypothetical protein